ncbi:sugar kinase [Candidatus Poribacteria bacterium]|jgi:2-dehydro-3-deoxygluconokinase|nr:sugar kinase [Candidatus Poribacteria bacterium]MBT5711055.1 sugar kinase [Candidatus Poribacteria bacterium]MBT7101537.1 sugar kinase [Candidatus Poribacteria bacterium]MBT7809344.1 sugar kinase [Candidatus Poribacteria bacterium]
MPEVVKYTDIKKEGRYDGVSLGEVMLRIDPRDIPTAKARDNIRLSQGGGETNVSCGMSYTFGLRTAVLTALLDDPVGENIRNQLREAGVDTSKVIWWDQKDDGSKYSADGKGTLHNGINFTYVGAGILPSDTTYYRANSVATRLAPGDFDFDALFGDEGVRVFNTGGILTLIGPNTADLAIQAAQKAAEHGTFVSADLNYRSKVEPNKDRAQAINRRLAPYLGMLVGNDSDLSDALGYETHGAKGASFDEWLDGYRETIKEVARDFPNLSLIGTQWRGAHNADVIGWGAALYDTLNDAWHVAALREDIPIRDRTGGGDSFASGTLSAIMKGHDLDTAVNWGAAHGILVQETAGDTTMVNQSTVEKEVARALAGGGVKATR